MSLTKLDIYEYRLLTGVIQIAIEGNNDPIIVDILSEIDRSNGRVYVEGQYFIMTGYEIIAKPYPGAVAYLNLEVTKTE